MSVLCEKARALSDICFFLFQDCRVCVGLKKCNSSTDKEVVEYDDAVIFSKAILWENHDILPDG